MTFKELQIEQTFDFVNPDEGTTFYPRCRKISSRKYCEIECPDNIHRVGSIYAQVYHPGFPD